MRIYHRGILLAEFGLFILAIAVGFGILRGQGYALPEFWTAYALAAGFIFIVWGISWEMRVESDLVSESVLTTIHWYARFYPEARSLLDSSPHPTWAQAFALQSSFRNRRHHSLEGDFIRPEN